MIMNDVNMVLLDVALWTVTVTNRMIMVLSLLRGKYVCQWEVCGGEACVGRGRNIRKVQSEKLLAVPM